MKCSKNSTIQAFVFSMCCRIFPADGRPGNLFLKSWLWPWLCPALETPWFVKYNGTVRKNVVPRLLKVQLMENPSLQANYRRGQPFPSSASSYYRVVFRFITILKRKNWICSVCLMVYQVVRNLNPTLLHTHDNMTVRVTWSISHRAAHSLLNKQWPGSKQGKNWPLDHAACSQLWL